MPTALAAKLARRIAREGPIGLADYMAAALTDPDHGYYMGRDPLGARGDFVTAPEVSQMFGELIGLWCAETWQALGRPGNLLLTELGPGRGTLMPVERESICGKRLSLEKGVPGSSTK